VPCTPLAALPAVANGAYTIQSASRASGGCASMLAASPACNVAPRYPWEAVAPSPSTAFEEAVSGAWQQMWQLVGGDYDSKTFYLKSVGRLCPDRRLAVPTTCDSTAPVLVDESPMSRAMFTIEVVSDGSISLAAAVWSAWSGCSASHLTAPDCGADGTTLLLGASTGSDAQRFTLAYAGCVPGYGYQSADGSCTICALGTASPGGFSACASCADGLWAAEGSAECGG
jgi:hypothetical protein